RVELVLEDGPQPRPLPGPGGADLLPTARGFSGGQDQIVLFASQGHKRVVDAPARDGLDLVVAEVADLVAPADLPEQAGREPAAVLLDQQRPAVLGQADLVAADLV